jgi:putative ABC transport system permease protein
MSHKLRSFLTILGIIFGVSAVIAMMSIGEGARQEVLNQIKLMGIHNIFILDSKIKRKQSYKKQGVLSKGLNHDDVQTIKELLPNIDKFSIVKATDAYTEGMSKISTIDITGISPDYFSLMNLIISEGRGFTLSDYKRDERICIIGQHIKKRFFKLVNPIGKIIQLDKAPHTIVGVLKFKGGKAGKKDMTGIVDSFDESIYVPYKSLIIRKSIDENQNEIDKIILSLKDENQVDHAAALLNKILYRRHYYLDDFKVVIPKELIKQQEETQKVFNIVMVSIAGISLLVGGIGIMNIMLANVLERTREIGLRRALGATMQNIRNQFLMESILLTVFGGLIGIMVGYILTFFISYYAEWNTAISFISVILSFGISTLIGVIFGYYPAVQASQLNPIEALRHE